MVPPSVCCAPALVRGLESPGLLEARALAEVILDTVGTGLVPLPGEAEALGLMGVALVPV